MTGDRRNILIVTPLLPPDVMMPSSYVKELAGRLSKTHNVTVLAYNHHPETIAGADIISVEKRYLLPLRLIKFTYKLLRQISKTDFILLQNGVSTELPTLLASFVSRKPILLHISDLKANQKMPRTIIHKAIHTILKKRTTVTLTTQPNCPNCVYVDNPISRPEIHPLEDFPEKDMAEYELYWKKNLATFEALFRKLYVN